MATKKQKRARMQAKWEREQAELRASNQHFLKLAQTQRAEERKKAEESAKQRKINTSKRLAKQHKREKDGIQTHKQQKAPFPRPLSLRTSVEPIPYDSAVEA